MEESTP